MITDNYIDIDSMHINNDTNILLTPRLLIIW